MANGPGPDPAPANDAAPAAVAGEGAQPQVQGVATPPPAAATTSPAAGRRVFSAVGKLLTDEELKQSGVQKLLLENIETAEALCEKLSVYVDKFHEADKQVGVLTGKLDVDRSVDVTFGVGIGVGCLMIGSAPMFWNSQPYGWLLLAMGGLITVGAATSRLVRR